MQAGGPGETSLERALPKRKRVPPVYRPRQRGPSALWQEERRRQLLYIGLGVAVVLVAALIALFGYYQTQVRPPGETVLEVGTRSFDLRYAEQRLRYDVKNGLGATYSSNPASAPDLLLNTISSEELMRQGASEKGVDISDEAIDAEIRVREEVPEDAGRDAFAAAYRKAVRESGLTTEGYRDVIAAGLAQNGLSAKFGEEAPQTADQVRFKMIAVLTEDEAKAALDRLHNGEDFAAVAKEVSADTASAAQGGDRDWTPRGVVDAAVDEALFSLEIGQTSEVLAGRNAYYIVQPLERATQRETTPEQRSTLGTVAMTEWLRQLRDRIGVTVKLDNDQRTSILGVLQDELS